MVSFLHCPFAFLSFQYFSACALHALTGLIWTFFGKNFFCRLMYRLKHIARVNGSHIMCTQYELNRADFNSVTGNPARMPFVHIVESMRQPLQCYHCSISCAWQSTSYLRVTKLMQRDECDTYVRDDICAYCSQNCLMREVQGVVDDRTQLSLGNSPCE